MRLLSWNVNGIRAVERKGFREWFEKEQPDILCIQETKARKEQLSSFLQKPEDYFAYFSSAEKKGYSGVAVYTKQQPITVQEGFSNSYFDGEGRTLRLEFESFILYNVYFPNGGMGPESLKYKLDFYDSFLKILKEELALGKKIIICGDVNTAHKEIDLARPKANEKNTGFLPEERAWIDRLLASGFIDTFRVFNKEPDNYTYWDMKTRARDRNVGWRIDYFFVSNNLKELLVDAFILKDVLGSDHCPVGIELMINNED